MDLNKLTLKSQEALSNAQNIAVTMGHTEVDGEHLLLALLRQNEGLIPRLLVKMGASPEAIAKEVENDLSRRSKVSGPGVEPGKIVVSMRLSRLLVSAEESAARMKDEYVSVEHIFSRLLEEGNSTPAGRILAKVGITPSRSLKHFRMSGEASGCRAPTRRTAMKRWKSTAATLSRWRVPENWTPSSDATRRSAA